jgi:hypothetical protein
MEESQSQAAVRSSSTSSSNLNSSSKDSEGKGKESTMKPISKTSQRAPSPNPHPERKPASPESLPRRSLSRSPARSTHSSSSTNHQTPKAIKSQAEGTHKLVEYVDEDGISHWHRQEHVNLHTECGRHGDEWLFGGWSLMGVVKGVLGRR